ncbi:DUF998 domain-containing protein [Erythrobacter insulae]|uniref:DUF998 domain-containing protein n=1 Tax=Erythrobacter insulae TaxID=2584124 RepID=A0A547P8T1_9SPHN|nr:DUF998 domain-containing protein [Erythrobacter insulae]TRD10562.1 DUF998 domain-containing protein [Erythrobacter insulae]
MDNNLAKSAIWAGMFPLPVWLLLTTFAGFLAQDYDPVSSHVSVMTLQDGAAHMIANIAALIAGISLIVFGAAIWRISRRAFSGGAMCWIVFGIAMISNGIWPMGSPMHGFYVIGIFNILAPALSMLDLQDVEFQDESGRRKMNVITTFVSLSGMLYLWLALTGFEPEGFAGLSQRIFGSINFAWPLLFAYYFRGSGAASLADRVKSESNTAPSA